MSIVIFLENFIHCVLDDTLQANVKVLFVLHKAIYKNKKLIN